MTEVGQRWRLAAHTIEAYRLWVRPFLIFSAGRHGGWTHPADLGTADVEAFLNDRGVRGRLSASAQDQALGALVFLHQRVLRNVIAMEWTVSLWARCV